MSSELLAFFAWYLVAVAAGLVALPLSFQLFRHLPDRGYSFSKALGLLATGWVFWFLGSLGFLRNDAPSILFAALVVGVGGLIWLGRPGLADLRAWLAGRRGLVLGAEALFMGSFILMAFVRAHNPDIHITEKPMEFMFINSILRSPAFPAHDAWLSGHAISYYYFGYVIIAAIARVTATASSVAFNLGLSLLFALIAAGAHGVVLNLIALQRARAARLAAPPDRHRPLMAAFWPALLGPLLVLVVGNFYGLAELAYTNGLLNANIWTVRYYYGKADPANAGTAVQAAGAVPNPVVDQPGIQAGPVNFWAWLDLKLAQPPAPAAPAAFTWNVGGNWFFAARVLHDRDLVGGESAEAIDEMPVFSFLLARFLFSRTQLRRHAEPASRALLQQVVCGSAGTGAARRHRVRARSRAFQACDLRQRYRARRAPAWSIRRQLDGRSRRRRSAARLHACGQRRRCSGL